MQYRYLMMLFIACAASGEARSAEPVRLAPAHLTFNLDASGKPSGFSCLPALPAPTCATIIAAAGRWKYKPGMSEGKPVSMRTWMTLNLQAVPKAGGFALTAVRANLREAGNPGDDAAAAQTTYTPPRYPKDAMRRGDAGLVVLELWFEPGSDRMSVRNAWLNGKKPARRSELVDAATAAATTWRLGPHSPKVLSICMPVEFRLDRRLRFSGTEPCQPTYAEGYRSPELITTPEQMIF